MSSSFVFPMTGLSDLEEIHACYASFGKVQIPHIGDSLASGLPRWQNPVMSPRISLTRDPNSIVANARALFDDSPTAAPFDTPSPYFNLILPEGHEPCAEWLAAISARGFKFYRKSTLVLFNNPLAHDLPKGFHFSSGNPFDRCLKHQFLDVMVDAFARKDRAREELFWKEIYKGMKHAEGVTRVVILRTSRGKPVGAGLVTTTSEGAYLWCGGIKATFRGRGLARPLIGLRQFVSMADGGKRWLYSTSNPRIEKFGDRRFTDHSFVFDSNRSR